MVNTTLLGLLYYFRFIWNFLL